MKRKPNLIGFSLTSEQLAALSERAYPGESPGMTAKRILLQVMNQQSIDTGRNARAVEAIELIRQFAGERSHADIAWYLNSGYYPCPAGGRWSAFKVRQYCCKTY